MVRRSSTSAPLSGSPRSPSAYPAIAETLGCLLGRAVEDRQPCPQCAVTCAATVASTIDAAALPSRPYVRSASEQNDATECLVETSRLGKKRSVRRWSPGRAGTGRRQRGSVSQFDNDNVDTQRPARAFEERGPRRDSETTPEHERQRDGLRRQEVDLAASLESTHHRHQLTHVGQADLVRERVEGCGNAAWRSAGSASMALESAPRND